MSSTVLRPIALAFGYDLRTVRRSDSIDLNLRRYFESHDIELLIDCGAHVGGFARMCRSIGYHGQIFSFEPVSSQFDILNNAAHRDPAWQARKLGLGARSEQKQLNINAGSNFNSLLPSKENYKDRFPALVTKAIEEVEIARLDQVLDEEKIADDVPIFLKTDTQGYDLEVLNGAGTRLNQIKAIMVEMPVQPIYEGAPDHWKIMQTLREHGFDLYAFSTVSRDTSGGIIEYDAIWKRCS